MNFKDKVVVLTGGAKGIGKCIKEMFEKQGAHVCIIDILENDYFIGMPLSLIASPTASSL